MTAPQVVVTRALTVAGAAAVALPLIALAIAASMGASGLNSGFGLYKVLTLAIGFAILSHAVDLRSADGWNALLGWWRRAGSERRADMGRIGAVATQLLLLYALIRMFEIENPAFWSLIAPLTLAGWAIHHLTASRFRQPMFLFLSLAAVWLVFSAQDALWLIAVGVALVGICHLPIPYWARVATVVVAGAALAAARMSWFAVPWSRAIWPILGSMFMFRMIVYLYDLRHEKVPAGWAQRIGYFFLLPNVVFPLFPVVDYAAYRRTYYDAEAHRIYQRGIEWIFRGILQLIFYRLIYHYGMIAQGEVATGTGVARFMVSNFLLYVRVSGQFHLIVGMLHLFGFHLPETHRQYFLASSFTDFWRRINIYWKDFMTKVFYYPLHFRLRRWGEKPAMIVATLFVFVMTWLLHSYQWFWLLGSFPITATDALFWGILAGLLVVNSLHEARHGRRRTLVQGARDWTRRTVTVRSLQTVGTFAAICVLWSVWMSPTLGDWLSLWTVQGLASALPTDGIPVLLVGAVVATGTAIPFTQFISAAPNPSGLPSGKTPSLARSFAVSATSIGVVLALGHPAVSARLGTGVDQVIRSLKTSELSKRDVTQLHRGYYEDLMGASRLNSQLWEIYMHRPAAEAWPSIDQTEATRPTGDFRNVELVPNARINFLGSVFGVNRWGMRDSDYEQAKASQVWRIAVLGASVEMGWGVGDGEPFEQITERLLNRDASRSAARYELLNFGVGEYTVVQQLMTLDRVFSFEPDVVMLAAHEIEAAELVNRLIERSRTGLAIPFDSLRSAAVRAELGIAPEPVVRKRLEEHKYELLEWMYRQLATRIRERGALPVVLLVPLPDREVGDEFPRIEEVATRAGLAVVSLKNAYAGHQLADLRVTKFDFHPNTRGHALLGDRFYEALMNEPRLLGADRPLRGSH